MVLSSQQYLKESTEIAHIYRVVVFVTINDSTLDASLLLNHTIHIRLYSDIYRVVSLSEKSSCTLHIHPILLPTPATIDLFTVSTDLFLM